MFKISQDITDDNDLYLHIRRKISYMQQISKKHVKSYEYT